MLKHSQDLDRRYASHRVSIQENNILNHIKTLIIDLKKDNEAQNKAKAIANDCFDKLVKYLCKSGIK